MLQITPKQRQEIIDYYIVHGILWYGNLEDHVFLAKLYDLTKLPSTDNRFTNAYDDIWKHRVANNDWDDDWVFSDKRFCLLNTSDQQFLDFVCMTLHPSVRADAESRSIKDTLNRLLKTCGYLIKQDISTLGVVRYIASEYNSSAIETAETSSQVVQSINSEYINRQMKRMTEAIEEDTELAIGTAKEFVETVCKSILRERGQVVDKDAKLPELVKETRKHLNLLPEDVHQHAKGKDTIQRLLSNLGTIAQNMAELRGLYGTGHGKDSKHKSLWRRHARLAVNSSIALGIFLWETHDEGIRESYE